MKINKFTIAILIGALILVGLVFMPRKKGTEPIKIEVAKKNFLALPEPYEPYDATEVSEVTPRTKDGNSYWFIVVQDNNGVSTTLRNATIKQNHPWFSYKEAEDLFKKDVFILNLVEISKETYEHNEE